MPEQVSEDTWLLVQGEDRTVCGRRRGKAVGAAHMSWLQGFLLAAPAPVVPSAPACSRQERLVSAFCHRRTDMRRAVGIECTPKRCDHETYL